MNLKKSILSLGITLALAGGYAGYEMIEANAAGWEARTVEEIKNDIETNELESTYTIQWGDTLGAITSAFEIPMNKVAQLNNIANVDLIMTGNVLHFSADNQTVSFEDTATKEVKTYDVSEEQEEVKEIAPVEVKEEPVAEEPAQEEQAYESPANNSTSEAEAKAWIAFKESTDNYNAVSPTGKYIGKYQLTNSYLNGDHSPENQERVADEYVNSRYGSWVAAKQFWLENGWY